MKAALIEKHGDPHTIQIIEREAPTIKPDQCLIRIKACGLNHLDTWVRRGVEGHRFPLPIVPGSDITGVVEKKGDFVRHVQVGSRVIVNPGLFCGHCFPCVSGQDHLCETWGLLGETKDGGCQEYIAIHGHQLHSLPQSISFEQGACIPITFVTAWQMLVEKGGIQPGQSILIHGAGSGVSIACIQIAKLYGLQIYVTSNSEDKLHRAKNAGAHRLINTSKEAFRDGIRNLTQKKGVDFVVDHVGSATMMESIKCLKKGGKLLSCGATTGAQIQIDWKYIFFKNLTLIGSTYGNQKDFLSVLRHFESHKLNALIDSTYPLEQIALAHERIEQRKVFGKLVIVF